MRIATWNLELPNKSEMQRLDALASQMKSVNADVWILTETSSLASPGKDFVPVATEAIQGEIKYAEGENRTTIWSRLPIIEVIRCQDQRDYSRGNSRLSIRSNRRLWDDHSVPRSWRTLAIPLWRCELYRKETMGTTLRGNPVSLANDRQSPSEIPWMPFLLWW